VVTQLPGAGASTNNRICRKGLDGALAKKKKPHRFQFYHFGLQMENNFQEYKFCCRSAELANEMRRCPSNCL
jgi:hypothetical protein